MELHTNRKLLLGLLIAFCLGFAVLMWIAWTEIPAPLDHLWQLTLHDRMFQLVTLDFLFFFFWVFFWMVDRARRTQRNLFPWLIVGLLSATLMIFLFILTESKREKLSV